MSVPLERQRHDGADRSADLALDDVDLLARRRAAVDRDDHVARTHAGLDRRIAVDRIGDDRALLVLLDVDADAAEVAAAQRLVEPVDLLRRQIRSVRVAEAAEHPGQRDLGVRIGWRDLRVAVLHRRQGRLEDRDVAAAVAGRAAARHLRIADALEFEEVGECLLLAGDQQLVRDGFVVGVLDSLVCEREHVPLIGIVQQRAEVETDDVLAGSENDRLRRRGNGGGAPGIEGAGRGGNADDERGGQQAGAGGQTAVLSKRGLRVVSSIEHARSSLCSIPSSASNREGRALDPPERGIRRLSAGTTSGRPDGRSA